MTNEITNRIKSLLKLKGKKNIDYAEYLGIAPQSLQNKFSRGYFSAEDLIKVAEFLDVELAFVEKGTKTIIDLDACCLNK